MKRQHCTGTIPLGANFGVLFLQKKPNYNHCRAIKACAILRPGESMFENSKNR